MGNRDMLGNDRVILATGGYDHTIRFWSAHNGVVNELHNIQISQVNALAITPDKPIANISCFNTSYV